MTEGQLLGYLYGLCRAFLASTQKKCETQKTE